jgi:hypothetical protein
MAWTQMKTAVVVGVVVVLAASTTTGVVVHHQHLAKTANYAAAEDTFQTAVQAMSKGDIKTIQASYTTEFGNQFMATAGKGKSDAELAAMFQQIAGMLNGVRIISIDPKPNDELLLHIQSPRLGMASVPMKKIGDTWKINGNITTDEPKK